MPTMTQSHITALGMGAFLCLFAPLGALPAQADIVISSAATQNITCSAGVCAPTATNAVLNVSDLETMLASGNLEVTTTGSGNVQADNIDIDAALSWSTANLLSFDAFNAITVNREISVAGLGGLTLSMPNDTLLAFEKKGHVVFHNLSSPLTIGGSSYTLVGDIKSLAGAVANNPSGAFALANSYDASADGTYTASPIQTTFTGIFEGLGNAISNLSIAYKAQTPTYLGFFEFNNGTVENFNLTHCKIIVTKQSAEGGITGCAVSYNGGSLLRVFVEGTIRGQSADVGGLVGANQGSIYNSSANVNIGSAKTVATVGDLVGDNAGAIEIVGGSFAVGAVSATGRQAIVGGLIGVNSGSVENTYATGSVTGGANSNVGGLVGGNSDANGIGASIGTSYTIGAVSGGKKALVGGFGGTVRPRSRRYHKWDYWDTDTSGTGEGTGKGNESGIVGMSTENFKNGLPYGFDPTIWAESGTINNGFPYLIANPPPK